MGRKKMYRTLNVWMNGELIGTWRYGSIQSFLYNPAWVTSEAGRPLSLSMPFAGENTEYRGAVVEAFFDNLLPDSVEMRKRIQSRFGTATIKPFDLLAEIGRDCVGAVQLLPEEQMPENLKTIRGTILTENKIEQIIKAQSLSSRYLSPGREFRISLAGAQEKTAFLRHQGKWYKPEGSTPTTHIFKRPLGTIGFNQIDLTTSVENEWLCSRIFHHFDLPVASCDVREFGAEKVLVVTRFDRRLSGDKKWWIRLPQEDFCQATGTSGGLKYERDGGPGIMESLSLLSGSLNGLVDRRMFFKAQIILWLLASPDGHAKNFSVFIRPGGRYIMTPFYDIISVFPVIGKKAGMIQSRKIKMAMAILGESHKTYHWYKMTHNHWINTAKRTGFSVESTKEILAEVLEQAPQVRDKVEQEIPENFPKMVSETILKGMMSTLEKIT